MAPASMYVHILRPVRGTIYRTLAHIHSECEIIDRYSKTDQNTQYNIHNTPNMDTQSKKLQLLIWTLLGQIKASRIERCF